MTPRPSTRRRGVGLRREVSILLPVAFLLLVVLSVFTLFAYREGVSLLVEERRAEATFLAQRVASELAGGRRAEAHLRELAPTARGVAVLSADGRALARSGGLPDGALLAPLQEPDAGMARAYGPDDALGDVVAAFAPVAAGSAGAGPSRPRWVRVDLGATGLDSQRRGLRVLSWVVLGIDAALLVLVILFLGRLLAPYDTLLAHARTAGEVPPDTEDEVSFLVATFERALEALARPTQGPEDEIALLQRTLAASFESGVLLLDREGAVLAVNPTGAELLEVAPVDDEAGGAAAARPLETVLAGRAELIGVLREAVAEGRGVRRREIETATPSGRALTLGLTVHPLRSGAAAAPGSAADAGAASPGPRDPRGFLVLFVDLTEVRRRTEQAQLADSLQQIGELAAGVAHELRNSLATLKGYLALVERAGRIGTGGDAAGGDVTVAEYVSEIRHETDHLQRVLEDFLSFARPGTARLERLDLHRVLARAAADPALAGAPVRLAPPPPGGFPFAGDPQLLERAFRNLLHNAVEAGRASDPPAPVEVAAATTDEGFEITVSDRGGGLPEDLKGRLFHPFASGRPEGVGLGLALARRIVLLHGGHLELDERPGGGTIARVTLPSGTTVT
jgi:signal transduction histidine kinase